MEAGIRMHDLSNLFVLENMIHKRCEICSKLTVKKPGQRQRRRLNFFIGNFKHISYLFPVFLLLTLNRLMFAGKQSFFHVI